MCKITPFAPVASHSVICLLCRVCFLSPGLALFWAIGRVVLVDVSSSSRLWLCMHACQRGLSVPHVSQMTKGLSVRLYAVH